MSKSDYAKATFERQVGPATGDKRGQVIPAFNLRRRQIALDNLLTEQPLNIKGDFLYLDRDSSGSIRVKFGSGGDPLPMSALDGFKNWPYEEIFIDCDPQPGLVANLWHGYGAEFIVGSQSIATIGTLNTIVDPVAVWTQAGVNLDTRDNGIVYGASFQSNTALVGNAPQAVFLPAANPNGTMLWAAQFAAWGAAVPQCTLLASNNAPANNIAGDVMLIGEGFTGQDNQTYGKLPRAIKIPFGYGLWFIADINATFMAQCKYTHL